MKRVMFFSVQGVCQREFHNMMRVSKVLLTKKQVENVNETLKLLAVNRDHKGAVTFI